MSEPTIEQLIKWFEEAGRTYRAFPISDFDRRRYEAVRAMLEEQNVRVTPAHRLFVWGYTVEQLRDILDQHERLQKEFPEIAKSLADPERFDRPITRAVEQTLKEIDEQER